MKWILVSVGGAVLLIGAYFVIGRSTPEMSAPQPTETERQKETVATALQALPAAIDLQVLANDTLAGEEASDILRYTRAWIEPLQAWAEPSERIRSSLEAGTSEWCAPYQAILAKTSDGEVATYFEAAEEERSVSLAERSMRLDALYGPWNDWLVRLAEAELTDKERRSVESFQEDFGELTDELEAAIDESVARWYAASDERLKTDSARAHWPGAIALGLATSSIDTARICAGEAELTGAERARLLGQAKQWEVKRLAGLRQNEDHIARLNAMNASVAATLESKARQVELELEAALTDLQERLMPKSS